MTSIDIIQKKLRYSTEYPELMVYMEKAKPEAIRLIAELEPLSERERQIFLYHFKANEVKKNEY